MYITQEMLENSTIQMSDGSLYLTQDVQQHPEDTTSYNTVFITPGELESAQQQTCQSANVESSEILNTEENIETEESHSENIVKVTPNEVKTNYKTLHVNVINLEGAGNQNSSIDFVMQGQATNDNVASQNGSSEDYRTEASAHGKFHFYQQMLPHLVNYIYIQQKPPHMVNYIYNRSLHTW